VYRLARVGFELVAIILTEGLKDKRRKPDYLMLYLRRNFDHAGQIRHIIPALKLKVEQTFAAYQATSLFYREVRSRNIKALL